MLPASSLSAKDRLRRTKSTRSMRRNRQSSLTSEPFDPDLAKSQATAAASRAMRRSQERSGRSSVDSGRCSYDRLGGPENLAVPARRRTLNNSNGSTTGDESSASPHPSTACYVENQDTYPVALGTINEFGGLDGRMSSLPSSYRRLRKAKSMFSTRQRGSHMSYGISSDSYGSPRASHDSTGSPHQYGTLRRSMSFLRGQPSRSVRHAKSQDAAIQLARTQFVQDRKPSIVTLKPKREHKPFRKTFRTVSATATDDAGTPFSDKSKASGGFHGKARSFSSSIKKGLKRVLGLSKSAEEPTSGQESSVEYQLDDQRSSVDSSFIQQYTPESGYSDYGSTDQQCDFSPPRPTTMRSVRSNDSLATSRSRVTSWADSTVANTVTNRKAGDRNSLSIINENATPTPGGRSRRGSPRANASIDGQRLYSALMKHIGQNSMENPDEQVVLGHVKEHRPIPERTSSLHSSSRQNIRHIPSNDSMTSGMSFSTANGGMVSPQRQRPREKRPNAQRYSLARENDRFDDSSTLRNQPLGSVYEIGEDCAEDSGSVIVDRSNNEDENDSPSVYSRTTNGGSPVRNDEAAGRASREPKEEEPGSAMVYESQRSVYSSPKRPASATPTQPSADWQKWMNSQMARIELTPTREHQREVAQIHEVDHDDDIDSLALDIFNGGSSLGLGEAVSTNSRKPSQSNFSRPFSRSSSMRSRTTSQKGFPADNSELSRGLSVRSSNRLQPPESPTPKRNTAYSPQRGQYRRYQTARMPINREPKAVLFRSVRNQRENQRPNDENAKTTPDRTSMYKYQDNYSPMSSKQMVDQFLDSRRRQMEIVDGEDSKGAFI